MFELPLPIPPSRIDRIENEGTAERGISLSVLREDLSHPEFGGNKWRKLYYNLLRAGHEGQDTLLSFGGVWSNHIYALAAAASHYGFKSIGIIRGEDPPHSTDTLNFARERGMKLQFVSRSEYQDRDEPYYKAHLHEQFGSFHLIPEGGANYHGVNGCIEILGKHTRQFDVIAVPCGTGVTLAGLVLGLGPHQRALGFPAIGKGEYLGDEVVRHLKWTLFDDEAANEYRQRFRLHPEYAFGGFARTSPELIEYLRQFKQDHAIQLDPLYTGKMMYGLEDLIAKGRFVPGTRILAVHTGGEPGIPGIERKLGERIYS